MPFPRVELCLTRANKVVLFAVPRRQVSNQAAPNRSHL
jgi:hypothetical protein